MDLSPVPDSPAASPSPPFRLSPLAQAFVLHFGEMGSRWGINRTVGQIYAMLFLADAPRHAEEISAYDLPCPAPLVKSAPTDRRSWGADDGERMTGR